MKKNNESSMQKIISSPVFFLGLIIVVFGAILYFSGDMSENNGLVSSYDYNPDIVTIVEYGDYQCPACSSMYEKVEQILKDYGDKVRLDYRHFPLSIHENAMNASMASECAREQDKFWEMHEKLYRNQNKLKLDDLRLYAKDLGLEIDKFNSCMNENKYLDKINKQKSQGELDQITGTPSFFINGKKLLNSENNKLLPKIDDFKNMINSELKEKKSSI